MEDIIDQYNYGAISLQEFLQRSDEQRELDYQEFERHFFECDGKIDDSDDIPDDHWDRLAESPNLTSKMIKRYANLPCGRYHGDPCNMFYKCNRGKWADGVDCEAGKWTNLSKNPAIINFLVEAIQAGKDVTDKINFNQLSRNTEINKIIVNEYASYLDWRQISSRVELNIKMIDEHKNYIWWDRLSKNPHLNLEILEEYRDKWDYQKLSLNKAVPQEFLSSLNQ